MKVPQDYEVVLSGNLLDAASPTGRRTECIPGESFPYDQLPVVVTMTVFIRIFFPLCPAGTSENLLNCPTKQPGNMP